MVVLGLDFETTGLDEKKDQITEIGAMLYDFKARTCLAKLSTLVRHEQQIAISPQVEAVTHISNEMVIKYGVQSDIAYQNLLDLINKADYIMAHKADFEKKFLMAAVGDKITQMLQWIDTMLDVPYPDGIKTRKLGYLCAEHGVWIKDAHRALPDVEAMVNLAAKYKIEDLIQLSKTPTVDVIADVSYDDRQKAKDEGFYWDGKRKKWHKQMKQSFYDPGKYQFRTKVENVATNVH